MEGTVASKKETVMDDDYRSIVRIAAQKAIGGGLAGATAMSVQVAALMWLHTSVNYQYRTGSTMSAAFRELYASGGIRRFYRGVSFALVQGPLARFGDTAANAGIVTYLSQNPSTRELPIYAKTFCGSLVATCWRILLMPIDTTKTILQVEGKDGFNVLRTKVAAGGLRVLYHGALASVSANLTVHFLWFNTHNIMESSIPAGTTVQGKLVRNAFIGFCCSATSDICANAARVVKVSKQTSPVSVSYGDTIRAILLRDGMRGVLFRGLKTRLLSNALQGMMFNVMWKALEPRFMKIWH